MARVTLKTKLVRTMVLLLSIVAVILIALLISVSLRFSGRQLSTIEENQRGALLSKARMLVDNHGVALKGLVLDNAFGDMQSLVHRAVSDDHDLVYGLFSDDEGRVLAFAAPGAPADRPDPKAYARLELADNALTVREPTIREVNLFGENILEMAAPVRDGTESLGTIRYGLSTRRMHDELRKAQAESQREIIKSLALSLGVALAAAILATLLSRREAERVAKPVTDLAAAAKALASGRRDVHVDIRSNDEVQDLGDAFNQMVADLKKSYDSLEDLNRNLENKVRERTTELAGRNRDMHVVLDNVEEGLLTLSTRGVMAMEHSAILDRWFGHYEQNTTFGKYIESTDGTFSASFELGWEAIVEDFLPLDLTVSQLPSKIEAHGNTWHVRYRPILSDGKLESMLVVIQDITAQLARHKEEQEQRAMLSAFQRLMRDRVGFMSFYRETTSLVRQIVDRTHDQDMSALKRVVHTIKGNAAMFGIEHVASLCHRMEDGIADTGEVLANDVLDELDAAWRVITDNVASVMDVAESTLEIPRGDVDSLAAILRAIPAARHLSSVVDNWKREPIHVALRRLAEHAVSLGRRLGKGEVKVKIHADNIRCDAARWAPFWSDAVHAVRNALDHGIELPEERERLGKGPPVLTFGAVWEERELVISIGDDGQGIAIEHVREKARALNLPHETKQDLFAALFVEGLSTRKEATESSGRGVGMGALKSRVEAMGGRVDIDSEPGRGTTLKFRFPERDSLPASPAG